MIYILSWTTKKAITFEVEENLRTFQGLPLKFKDFSRLGEPYSTVLCPTYVCSRM